MSLKDFCQDSEQVHYLWDDIKSNLEQLWLSVGPDVGDPQSEAQGVDIGNTPDITSELHWQHNSVLCVLRCCWPIQDDAE